MGSFLEKPETTKHSLSGEGNSIKWGLSEMQGWRMDMEDAHFAKTALEGKPDYSFFGIFDGHGGKTASKICSEKLIGHLKAQSAFKSSNMDDLKAALRQGFLDMDRELAQMETFRAERDASGTTAVTVLVSESKIVCANLGDSRAVMCSNGKAIALSHDHKPVNEAEVARIRAAGGHVTMGRVNGDLAVSRAFGDFPYKDITLSMEQVKQMVSPEPEILVRDRDNADEFVIIACDGIWDVMTNEECVSFIRDMAPRYDNVEKLAEKLLDTCLDKGSKDNMSAIILLLPGAPKPDPTLVAEQSKKDEEERLRREAEDQNNHGNGE